jgi:hypothetical protein
MTMTLAATNLAGRRDLPVVCAACGRRVERTARGQLYCGTRCRKRANYAKAIAEGRFGARPAQDTALGTNPPKKLNGANQFGAGKSRSSIPPNLLREVIETEVFAGHSWCPVLSSGGVYCEVSILRPRALRDNGVD